MLIKRQPISGRTYACLCPNTIIKFIISHFVYNVKAISVNLCQMTRIFQKKSDIKKAKRTKKLSFRFLVLFYDKLSRPLRIFLQPPVGFVHRSEAVKGAYDTFATVNEPYSFLFPLL